MRRIRTRTRCAIAHLRPISLSVRSKFAENALQRLGRYAFAPARLSRRGGGPALLVAMILLVLGVSFVATAAGAAPGGKDAAPRDREAGLLNNRGAKLSEEGKLEEAIAVLTRAIKLDPAGGLAYYNRGTAYLRGKQIERAIADYSEAIRLDPSLALAHMNRGLAFSMQNRLDAALVDLNEAIRLDPGNADSYYNRGLVFAKLGRFPEAAEDYTLVLRLNDRDAMAYVARAGIWERLGMKERAIADYRRAVAVDPANQTATKRLLQLGAP